MVGFVPGQVPIRDPEAAREAGRSAYDNVIPTSAPTDRVAGVAFEVTEAELRRADQYESPAGYERITTVLGSGRAAWVYLNPAIGQRR